jgi:arylsulfatase
MEGGIATPLIAYWPATIRAGSFNHQMGHVTDIIATCADLAGTSYPESTAEGTVLRSEGTSLAPAFRGARREVRDAYFWGFGLDAKWSARDVQRVVRTGRWKAYRDASRGGAWQLFDMVSDRTEINDLASRHKGRAAELAAQWEAWANRCDADAGVGVQG